MSVATLNNWLNEDEKQIDEIIREGMFRTRCCIPAIVQSYDPLKNTVECQPAIRERLISDTEESFVQIPLLINVPVAFPEGKAGGIKFPLVPGDEVLVVFSDLSIDNFWIHGNLQNPIEARRHDLSDGIAIPCRLSIPNNSGGVSELTLSNGHQTLTFSQLYKAVNNHTHIAPQGGGQTSGPM